MLGERLFRAAGFGAVFLATTILVAIIGSIFVMGAPAFTRYDVTLSVDLKPEIVDPRGTRAPIALRTESVT